MDQLSEHLGYTVNGRRPAVIAARRVLRAARKRERWTRNSRIAITSTPSSVRLVSSLRIDWVDGIEIVLGLLRGVQIYEPNEVRIKTSRSGDHKRQKTDIAWAEVVVLAMFLNFLKRSLLERTISVCVVADTQGAVGDLPTITVSLVSDG